jgi:4-amino-4-deoxy-L-arabinose transferase-like glycosyltransferase
VKSKTLVLLLVVVAAGLAARLVLVAGIDRPQQVPRNIGESDAPTYVVLADNILGGTGYRYGDDEPPTAKRTPGYPLFLVGVFKVLGRSFTAVRVVQCLLDAVTIYMVFTIAMLLAGSPVIALLAALGYAVYPPAVMSATYILSETLYTFFLVLFALSAVMAIRRSAWALYAVSGIAAGLAMLTRPGILLLPPVLLIVGWIAAPKSRPGLVLLVVAFGVTLLPWVVRNQRDLGEPVVTSTLVGPNLYKGNHLESQGAYFMSTDSLLTPEIRERLADAGEVERDRILREEAIRMIRRNPGGTAALAIKKIPRLWLNLGYGRPASLRSYMVAAFNAVLLGLGLLGIFHLPADRRVLVLVPVTTILVSSAMYLAVAAEVRFVFPLIALLFPLSAAGLMALVGRVRPAHE